MDWRFTAVSALLLSLCTGCPRTWGRGGTMDRAMERDLQENLRQSKQPCTLSEAERAERCEDPEDWDYFDCPRECR